MFGDELVEGFREFKALWDPDWQMNPGKVVAPHAITSDLRLGPDYRPARVKSHFAYPQDRGSFAHATLRCVGIGNCRKTKSGVMCPSYMVTMEEKHSTRGRAHLLWDMLQDDGHDVWRSEDVLDALDLCLSCKGCTHECPVNVDMPTLKAEFLAHHYAHKPRPRHAYAFGLIDQWARLAARAPRVANFVTQTPGLARIAKASAGASQERRLPAFAPQTFQAWFASREPRAGSKRVLFWPDTFTNHFEPEVGISAVEELEAAGFHVQVPRGHVCCGRPLYDYGFLGLARRYLRRTLAALGEEIRTGIPIVGVEPSCVAVFRDELVKMLPDDEDAKRLCKQTFHLAEFLSREDGYEPPQLVGRALLHGHCHGRATKGFEPEQKLLERVGLAVDVPDSGCCGMAGAWGYEADHFEVSRACAERVLLPAVRDAAPQTLLVASGFSCRSQVEQLAGPKPLHVAQVLRLARGHALEEKAATRFVTAPSRSH
jgi:Fe-S oxidoreductase